MTSNVRVSLGVRSYDIVIGEGLIAHAGKYIMPLLKSPRVIVVTDKTVAKRYLPTLENALAREGAILRHVILPAGEKTKSFAQLEGLMEKLLAVKPDRQTTLIALGGGVIGDITGFAASILLRGVDFVQVPTTLLAQVDSSVGGKTGINTEFGKNLVGSFYQPRLVLADVRALRTLPSRELLAGYAEVVKYGIINQPAFFSWLEKHGKEGLKGKPAALAYMVEQSCRAKAEIVGADEREAGGRALLNFGHTLGHALEAEMKFSSALLHGEAVAIGMMLALRLSVRLGLCDDADYKQVERHFRLVGLPTSPRNIRASWNMERLIGHCTHDKKVTAGRLTFILARGIGKTFISQEVKNSDLKALLAEALRVV